MAVKFLIIRFSSIGDIIQCMNVVDGIKNKFPDAEIHWIARKDMSTFLSMDKRIDRIWGFDKKLGLKGLWQIAGELKKERFDYIYDAHSNIRSNILRLKLRPLFGHRPAFSLRSKERWKRLLLFRLGINRFPKPFKGMVSFQKPLKKWGITDFTSTYSDWQFPADYAEKWQGLIRENTVTLVPSANWEMKRWPVSHWKALVELLPEYRFIILAGPTDSFCREIEAVNPEQIINLAGMTTLPESCFIVKESKIVVSADTGFMHAADLFGTQTLALMGPTAFGFPGKANTEVMEIPLNCRPCTKDGRGKCKQNVYQKCMVDIKPAILAQRIKTLLPL